MEQIVKTKSRDFVLPAIWVLSAVLSLTGCSKDPAAVPVEGGEEIAVDASFPAGLEAASTKASVDGSTQMTLYFGRSDESSSGVWGTYGSTALRARRAAGTGSQALTFTPTQYYLKNGLKTRMKGWYPEASSYTGTLVSWTIDGTQDIMLAPAQEGSKTTAMPAFTFSHKLTQLQFYCYAENQTAVDQWGKITGIKVLGQRKTCAYNITSGVFEFSGGSSYPLSVSGITAATAPAGQATVAKRYGEPLMIEPKTTATQLSLEIETEKLGTQRVVVPAQIYKEGESAKILLYFRMQGVRVTCTPQEWVAVNVMLDDVGSHNANSYPYILNGNTIVVKDNYGPAVASYPTHDPWAQTPAHEESAWDSNESGYNTVGKSFRIAKANAVGKDGSSAGVTWYEATGTQDATYNPAGYSACSEYSETDDQSDKGTWRVPTVRELKLMYEKGTSLSMTIRPAYSGYYWSATDKAGTAGAAALAVYYQQSGVVSTSGKGAVTNYKVRCIRDTKVIPFSRLYPKVLNGNIIVVEDLAGRADTSEYPVHNKWRITPPHSVSAMDLYNNILGLASCGRKFQVSHDIMVDKDGSSAMMTWYEATGMQNATYNSTGYSACSEYSETDDQSDKGTWRVPTVSETKLIRKKRGELSSVSFPVGSNYYCWSATICSDCDDPYAYVINWSGRNDGVRTFDFAAYVYCIREL